MSRFTVAIGDRVAFSSAYCRSIGQPHGHFAEARGNVVEITSKTEVRVQFDGWAMPAHVDVKSIAKVGPNSRFANC